MTKIKAECGCIIIAEYIMEGARVQEFSYMKEVCSKHEDEMNKDLLKEMGIQIAEIRKENRKA